MTEQMQGSWLVQRLEAPRNSGLFKDNPFAFGGGYKNGGLSDVAMDLIRPIFGFDYMGAAEFEFGAVPEALNRIAKAAEAGDLVANSLFVDLGTVEQHWQDRRAKKSRPTGSAEVFVLCRAAHAAEVADRIREWATKDFTMKEATNLPRALDPREDFDRRTRGWLELDNGFMFFVDRGMWASTCELFGVRVPAEVSS